MGRTQKLFFFLFVCAIGALGGIVGERVVFPYLASFETLAKFRFIRSYGTTIIRQEPRVVIQENESIQNAISEVRRQVIGVAGVASDGTFDRWATGVVVTADGLILTSDNVLGEGLTYRVYFEGENVSAAFRIRDSHTGLALFRVEKSDLPIVSFAARDSIRLGEPIFLLGREPASGGNLPPPFISFGILSFLAESRTFRTEFPTGVRTGREGAPLFDVEGKLIGLVSAKSDGELIPANIEAITTLIDLSRN